MKKSRKRRGGEEKTLQNLLRRGLRSKAMVILYVGPQSPSPKPRHDNNKGLEGCKSFIYL